MEPHTTTKPDLRKATNEELIVELIRRQDWAAAVGYRWNDIPVRNIAPNGAAGTFTVTADRVG